MRPDTIFRISSMTKPVTAVATLILLEECVLRLDEPVERFLPELANRRVVRRIDGPVDDTVPAAGRSPCATCSPSAWASAATSGRARSTMRPRRCS